MDDISVTRGYGLLEGFLAKKRTRMANQLIPSHLREGSVLDIGCGTFPYFLLNTVFAQKCGLDKVAQEERQKPLREEYGIDIIDFDLECHTVLPYDDNYFEVVTMLAVVEHIEPEILRALMIETSRVLKPDGIFIVTTPAPWTDLLLKMMAKLRLVSRIEIEEHKATHGRKEIGSMLAKNGFEAVNIRSGYFEGFMNIWVIAKKQ
jgi:ubiquinone/menaquinone biosynthesis C-methylase UbiE